MPTTIRALSWNVANLGPKKALTNAIAPGPTEIINFMGRAIVLANAGIVGIMEIQGGIGAQIMSCLLSVLNNSRPNNPTYTWQARLSSRQDGGTMEETLFAWKQQVGVLTLDMNGAPGPTSLIGVADLNAIEGLIASKGWTSAQGQQLLAALKDNGYLLQGQFKKRSKTVKTQTLRVQGDQWNTLNQAGAGATVTFATGKAQPPSGFASDAAGCQAVAAKLVAIDILRFVAFDDRSPYLANFLLGGKSLTVSLYHAPGPGQLPGQAINVIGLSRPLQAQVQNQNMLLMGDFNVPANRMNGTFGVYGRYAYNKSFVFRQVTRRPCVAFGPITGAPLTAPDLLPNVLTSLTDTVLPDATTVTSTLANAYDKFFFHGSTTAANQITQANAAVFNLVQAIAANQTAFNQPLGASALTYYRAYKGAASIAKERTALLKRQTKAQNDVQRAQDYLNKVPLPHPPPANSAPRERYDKWTSALAAANVDLAAVTTSVANIGAVATLVSTATTLTPTGVGTGLAIFRGAISDHLPITVDLTAS